jgi:hypothetical protein
MDSCEDGTREENDDDTIVITGVRSMMEDITRSTGILLSLSLFLILMHSLPTVYQISETV